MSDSSSSRSGGIGFVGLLTILFIALKLTGVINWSWVWVLAPMWIGACIGIGFLVLFIILALLAGGASSIKVKRRRR